MKFLAIIVGESCNVRFDTRIALGYEMNHDRQIKLGNPVNHLITWLILLYAETIRVETFDGGKGIEVVSKTKAVIKQIGVHFQY